MVDEKSEGRPEDGGPASSAVKCDFMSLASILVVLAKHLPDDLAAESDARLRELLAQVRADAPGAAGDQATADRARRLILEGLKMFETEMGQRDDE